MGKLVEMVGRRFGRLTVVERLPSPARRIRYLCLCDCGTLTDAYGENLRNGHVKSCGCYRVEHAIAKNTTHGKAGTRTYEIWKGITKRCKDQKDRNYGARGITVCKRWKDYEAFLADMGECPPGLSIERIDVNGHYSPENCRWASHKEQMRNMRKTRRLTLHGVTKTILEWSEISGLKYATIYQRIRDGCPPEYMLSPPPWRNALFKKSS